MWFIGGCRDATDNRRQLVVLGQEPLQADHFDQQVAFSTVNYQRYEDWQLEYFTHFPTNGGHPPQVYWRTMHTLIAGFRQEPDTVPFDWARLAASYIELPLVPLHSPQHVRVAFAGAATQLRALLLERLRCVVRCTGGGQGPVFLAAGAAVADALGCPPDGAGAQLLPMPPDTPPNRQLYGNQLWKPIHAWPVELGLEQEITVWIRRAPFAQGWQPTHRGLHRLGEILSCTPSGGAAQQKEET
ncbi:hypothetical protein [Sorangium sp. So ce1097]|uniref:hypothetical protein n=1 Tax=Sorangium sp. So ce1097 TaxID=3133330 RepID=UPI003F6448D0